MELGKAMQRVSESLMHEHKKELTAALIMAMILILRRRFRAQGRRAIAALGKIRSQISGANSVVPMFARQSLESALTLPPGTVYQSLIDWYTENAFINGRGLAYDQIIGKGPDRAASYDRSKEIIFEQIDQTTAKRMNEVLTESFAEGLSYAALALMIRRVFSDAVEKRAEAIATYEIARAFNEGGLRAARELAAYLEGTIEKLWNVEDNPCPRCEANNAQGWIPVDDPFLDGDAPPLHVHCVCSLDFRTV